MRWFVLCIVATFVRSEVRRNSPHGDESCAAGESCDGKTAEELTSEAKSFEVKSPSLALKVASKALAILSPKIKTAGGKWLGEDSLTWSEALMVAGTAMATMGRYSEAVSAVVESVQELERSPPRTTDRQSRPLEMAIIGGKLELSWIYTRKGDHPEALEQLRQARLYTPKRQEHRDHFDMVASFAEGKAHR